MTKPDRPDFSTYGEGTYIVIIREDGFLVVSIAADGSVWIPTASEPRIYHGMLDAINEISWAHDEAYDAAASVLDPDIDKDDSLSPTSD